MDGTGLFGTGLFSSGTDFSTWTIWEWGTIALGAYMVFATFSTTKRATHAVRRKVRAAAKA